MGTYADPNFTYNQTLQPVDMYQAQDLTQAANTVLCSFTIPKTKVQYLIKKIGMVIVNIGTSVTTPAQIGLKLVGPGAAAATTYLTINGTLSTTVTVTTQNTAMNLAPFLAVHPGSTCIAYQTVEADMNQTVGTSPVASSAGVSAVDTLDTAPNYFVWPYGCLAQLFVSVQGIGGTQTAWPYIVVQRDWTAS